MLGDILLIGDLHRKAAKEILGHLLVDKKKKGEDYKYIVAISGESGSGKTELGHVLANDLKKEGVRGKLLHLDNYYRVQPLLRAEWRKTKGVESVGIDEIDWKLLNKNIQDFKEGRESMIPMIDIIPEQVDKLITDFSKIDVLVLDGLYAINAEDIDLKVFIDLTYHETKMSQLIREKEIPDEFRMHVLEQEHQNVRKLMPLANLMVNEHFEVIKTEDYHIQKQQQHQKEQHQKEQR